MAVSVPVLDLLLQENRIRPWSGRLAILGKQKVWTSLQVVRTLAQKHGCQLRTLPGFSNPLPSSPVRLTDSQLFRCLGFDEVVSIDSSDFEGADVVLDLNTDEMPTSLRGQFDAVLDIGVMEHVFDIAQGFKNLHDMLRVNGRLIMFNPTIHGIDSCFFMLSPTLFHDYFTANKYLIQTIKLLRHPEGYYHTAPLAEVIDYAPGCLDNNGRGLEGCYWDVMSVATKTAVSTAQVRPIQRHYAELHAKGKPTLKPIDEEYFPDYLEQVPAPAPAPFGRGDGVPGIRALWRATLNEPFATVRIGPMPPAHMLPDGRFGYVVDLPALGVFSPSENALDGSAAWGKRSRLVLLEDGKPVGPAQAMHDVVRNTGQGAFSHWNHQLYFSSSDNSDPRTNGRMYTMLLPKTIASTLKRMLWLASRMPRSLMRSAGIGKLRSLITAGKNQNPRRSKVGSSKAA
jgi:hypothetical protein